jgi:fluoride exporter
VLVGTLFEFFTHLNPTLRTILAISLGAVPGALSRYYLGLLLTRWLGHHFPYATLIVNLTGALLMGFFVTLALERMVTTPELRLLIAVGFLGSYTTFSTYVLEADNLLRAGQPGLASLYGMGSAVMGVICLEGGSFLARKLP